MRALLVGFLVLVLVQISFQQCNIQANTNYNGGELTTLYGVASTQDCCSSCQSFAECSFFSYNKGSKQCVIRTSSAKIVTGSVTGVDSGSATSSYTRPTDCSQQYDANTDYFLQDNLGSSPSSSPSDCCNRCASVVGCHYWTLAQGTCWFKQSMGQKKSATGISSGTVIPASVKNTPKRVGKRGLGLYGTQACSDIKKLTGVSWVYNWKETPDLLEECFEQLGIQYIPMVWGRTANFDNVFGRSPYLLTFNEPNFSDQANMSPQEAAGLWPQVQAVAAKYGMLISSPSASYGGNNMPDAIAWLDQFFAACVGCKVDFITTHQYDCTPVNLRGAISNFYKYNLPVWVTEFSCYGANVADATTFVNGIVPLFENDPKIGRYSYFGSRSAGGAGRDVFDATKSALTQVGVAYNGGAASTPAPTTTPTSAPTTVPTTRPTSAPTASATPAPTTRPTTAPTSAATPAPTTRPTPGPTSPPATSLPQNGFLQSKSNSLYVALDANQKLAAIATTTATAIYFKFSPISGGYTLQNGNQFVSADNGGSYPLVADRYSASGWETFAISQPQTGDWAIKASANSLFVTVQSAQGNQLIATSASYSTASALFRIIPVRAPTSSVDITTATRVKLFSVGGNGWVRLEGYPAAWVANAGDPAAAVAWNVARSGSGYTLQNAGTSLYCSADNAGAGAVVANRNTAGGWEGFSFSAQSGGLYAIQALANNLLVSLQSNGQFIATVPASSSAPSSALFYVVAA